MGKTGTQLIAREKSKAYASKLFKNSGDEIPAESIILSTQGYYQGYLDGMKVQITIATE